MALQQRLRPHHHQAPHPPGQLKQEWSLAVRNSTLSNLETHVAPLRLSMALHLRCFWPGIRQVSVKSDLDILPADLN
jgi:hypothetical protein